MPKPGPRTTEGKGVRDNAWWWGPTATRSSRRCRNRIGFVPGLRQESVVSRRFGYLAGCRVARIVHDTFVDLRDRPAGTRLKPYSCGRRSPRATPVWAIVAVHHSGTWKTSTVRMNSRFVSPVWWKT